MAIKIMVQETNDGRWIVTDKFGKVYGYYDSFEEAKEKADKLQLELDSRIEEKK